MEESLQYVFDLVCTSDATIRDIISIKDLEEGFRENVLKWIAITLNSEDALMLSIPDESGQMTVQDSYSKNSKLRKGKSITCCSELRNWLDRSEPDYSLNNTTGIIQLENLGIQSLSVLKINPRAENFNGKQILMICNRSAPAIKEQMYVTYDNFFFRIAKWILELHAIDSYKIKNDRYRIAEARYRDSKIASSLNLLGRKAKELLDIYIEYNSNPPSLLLYNCLDTHISMFNACQKEKKQLKSLIDECQKHWLTQSNSNEKTAPNLVRYALARGYFALGIDDDYYWREGNLILKEENHNRGMSDAKN